MTEEEQWKPVVGWAGYYEVSDAGRVRSVYRVIVQRSSNQGRYQRRVRSRLLKGWKTKTGHHSVTLQCGGHYGRANVPVHRLVLTAFVGLCPPGKECCHRDGDPSNNRLDNLRWDTRQANVRDMIGHGTDAFTGSRNHASRLTEGDVAGIRIDYATGRFTQQMLADRHGYSLSAINSLLRGRTWKHAEGPIAQ